MLATENSLRKFITIFAVAATALLIGCAPAGPRALVQGDELLRAGKPAQAVEKLKRATQLLPDEPRAWNLLGVAYHRAGQPQMAVQAYRQALARDRSNMTAVAHYNLGCLLLEQNNVSAAVDELRSFTLTTNSVAGLVKLGAAQLRLRQFDAAERNFEAARRLDPKNAEALNGIGVVHAQRNQRDAAQYFNNALQADGKYTPAILNAGVLALQSPATRLAALHRFREYLGAVPQAPQAEMVKLFVRQLEAEFAPPPSMPTNAIAALKTNALRAALEHTNTAIQTNAPPRMVGTLTNVKPAVAMIRSNETFAMLKTNAINGATTIPVLPTNLPVTIINVADQPPPRIASPQPVETAKANNPSAVTPGSSSGPDLAPSNVPRAGEDEKKPGIFTRLNPFRDKPKPPVTSDVPRTIVLNAQTNAAAMPPKPAFARYTYLSPSAPTRAGNRADAERVMSQGVKAQRAGDTNEALRNYQLAINTDPTYFDAHYNLALLAFQAGDLKRSLAAWETALALQPDSINARYNFALALKQGNYAYEAVQELQRILEAKPNEVRAHLILGNLLAQQFNDPSQARSHYMKVLELDPRNPQAPAIRYWLVANP